MNLLGFISSVINISIPYILCALGGLVCERGGTINIALEGFMLTGAFFAVLGTDLTGNFIFGLILAALAGMLLSCLHGIMCLKLKVNQIISAVSINLFAIGITKFLLKIFFKSSSNSTRVTGFFRFGFEKPKLLAIFFDNPVVILTFLLVFLIDYLLYKTVFGLRLRSCGENTEGAKSLGINTMFYKWAGVLISGFLCGLAGAWLSLEQHQFTDGMSGGRGFIAIAAIIFGKWKPKSVFFGCFIFAAAEALQINLQIMGTKIPTQFIQMLPFVLTLLALLGFVGKGKSPADLGN